jgi:hypothetical protein
VEVQGRKFRISALDAWTGSYLLFTVFEKMLPSGVEQQVMSTIRGEGKDPEMVLPSGRTLMTKAEFFSFQRDCLSAVSEILPGRDAPILNANGSWGVQDVSVKLALILTVHALMFNIQDFFAEDGLKDLMSLAADFKDLMPSATKI